MLSQATSNKFVRHTLMITLQLKKQLMMVFLWRSARYVLARGHSCSVCSANRLCKWHRISGDALNFAACYLP